MFIESIFIAFSRVAIADSNILIEGETLANKEFFAELIHKYSNRADKPFVVMNCASLPDQLIESELFGYEQSTFTDTKNTKVGLIEIANGGTLFLDEIGELSLSLQLKLQHFLENGEYKRIGGIKNLHSNVRLIGATNRMLSEEIDNKKFNQVLLSKLNLIKLTIPEIIDRQGEGPFHNYLFRESKIKELSQRTLSK